MNSIDINAKIALVISKAYNVSLLTIKKEIAYCDSLHTLERQIYESD